MTEFLSKNYWNNRYETEQTGWDLKTISPPLKAYIDQLMDKNLSVLIPGCGSGYEAEYLLKQGFNNVTVIDFAPLIVDKMKAHLSEYQNINIICTDFFVHTGEYDLILEQTFFCALNPSLRTNYVQKMAELLKENGKLVGLLFGVQFSNNPPFGGSEEEYLSLFSDRFTINVLEPCYNSVKPRQGSELFFNFSKNEK
ncbi:MAG: methyltransferase domain-containing protein [Arcicella sp.]|nr:methyltransferase domain-containing protein [Arcicella sp.]